jgi:arylformamidase
MRRTFILAIVAASFSTPVWAAFTPPSSPAYCPWPAWHLPDAQPGDAIVYTDPHGVTYTKPQIDSAYDQVCWQQDPPDTGTRDSAMTADFRSRLPPERYAYGPSQFEGLDLYRTSAWVKHAPTMIFIHGGAWRAGSAQGAGYMAENYVDAGANFIALDFINVTQTVGADGKPDKNLITMAEQVRAGVAWVYKNAKKLGLDKDRIYVSGHSSGGHLCGVVITTDWHARGLPRDMIKGAVCASGMYDLIPASLSARNLYLNFQLGDTITQLSPILHLDRINMPVVVGHGTKETPEFQRQNDDFAAALRAVGKNVTLVIAPGYNHFEFAETFASPYGYLGRAALKLMGLQPGSALIFPDHDKDCRDPRHHHKRHDHHGDDD